MRLKELVELTSVSRNNLIIIANDALGRRIEYKVANPYREFKDYEVARVELLTQAYIRIDGSTIIEPALKVFVYEEVDNAN